MENELKSNFFEGKEIVVTASDPWKFCSEFGTGPFNAVVLRVSMDLESMLLKFNKSFLLNDAEHYFFVASIRHKGSSLKQLLKGMPVHLSFLSVSEEQINKTNPFDTSWWRGGGITFIGTLEMAKMK